MIEELTKHAGQLVGRDDELEAIDRVLDAVPERPYAVLVEGEAGIGKTRVWEEALHRAGARGYRIVSCRTAESEVQLGFTALGDLLAGSFDDVAPHLPEPQQRALGVALLRVDPGEQPVDQRAVATGFLTSLRRLSAAQPLVVAVDDTQWLDAASASVLEFAFRRLHHEAIGLLLTLRGGGEAEAPLALDRALDPDRLTRLQLGALSLGALQRLLQVTLGLTLARPALQRIHEASGGNPFFALEVGRALKQSGGQLADDGQLPVSRRLDELLHARIGALAPEVREILVLAALLANPTVSLLERASSSDVEPTLAPARLAAIVAFDRGRVRFTHPLLASTCLAHVDDDHRRHLHRRLAEIVESTEERARHLALASDQADADLAALLEESANRLRVRGGGVAVVELLEHARRLTPAGDRSSWARRSTMLADLLYYSGDEGAALRIADEVIERADAGTDRALALALSSLYVATKVARFDQARTEAGDDLALQARIGLMEAATLGQAGDWHGRAARLDETLEAARGSGDDALIAQTLTMTAWSVMFMVDDKGSRDRARAELVEALQIEERLPASAHAPAIWSPKTKLGIWAMYDEELDDARRMLADERARAVEHGDDWSLNGVLCFASEVERRAGRCKRAHDLALQSYQVAKRNADPQGRAVALVHLALIQALLGPLADARATAARAKTAAEEIGDRFFAAQGRAAAGLIALCVGDHAMVLHEVGTMPEELRAFGRRYDIESPHAAAIGDEIEARIALGDLEAARRRIDELCERACRLGRARPLGVAQRGRGLLLAAEGRTPEALEAFEASLAVFDNIQAPFECARTLLAFGTVQRRAKRRRAARESLQAAVAILEEIGAAPWAQKARAELARIGGRARGGDELTATERRVAELVAEGRTNREVAAALFVTPRTVEWNLTKIYAKLHVRSRAELTRRLSEPNLLNH